MNNRFEKGVLENYFMTVLKTATDGPIKAMFGYPAKYIIKKLTEPKTKMKVIIIFFPIQGGTKKTVSIENLSRAFTNK